MWYKAPEVLLRAPGIGPECDVWSAGLIIAELLNRRPLFPGASYVEQLRLITDCFGMKRPATLSSNATVRASDLAEPRDDPVLPGPLSDPSAGSSLLFLSGDRECPDAAESRRFLLSMAPKGKVPLRTLVPTADKFIADLLECMLQFAPSRRKSAQDLQQHPMFHGAGATDPDTLIVHRDPAHKREPLGFVWEEFSGEAVLADVAEGGLAERAGAARFVGCRAMFISPPTRGAGDGPTYQHKVAREEPIEAAMLRRGDGGAADGRLWLEENPKQDRDVRVTIRFGDRVRFPLDPNWAVPLHIAQFDERGAGKLNAMIWDCLRPFNTSP